MGSRRARTSAARAVVAALLAALSACATADTERNLAPLYSSHSAAGGVPEIEALGGAILTQKHPETGGRKYWAVRPIVSNRKYADGDSFAWFLPPLGFVQESASRQQRVAQLVPLARYSTQTEPSGFQTWSLLVLPGIYWAGHEDGRVQRAFFPFGGVVEKFLSLDRGTFVLFPLWLRVERYGRTTDHVLWPFFTYSRGAGGPAWRVWPLIGNISWDGRYDRWFFLWPFFHWQRNDLQYKESEQRKSWLIWPLIGNARREGTTNWTFLWPFFGYAKDDASGFWAWDGPWPLVLYQGGDPDRAVRKRAWPFYSYYQGDGLTSRWYAWPFVNRREEIYEDGTKKAFKVLPFWRSYTRDRKFSTPVSAGPVGEEKYRMLWPLGRVRKAPGESDLVVVDLNPFQRLQFIQEHYAWTWQLYTRYARGEQVRSRSWLGLWRREKDGDEDRRSLSVLWSARDYTRAGRTAHERSFLFGLLRYRTVDGEGFTFLRPAFPGPGWPMRRTPSSTAPAVGVKGSSRPLPRVDALDAPLGDSSRPR
ncbi:MAG: hypothetical protein AAGA20_22435 [Planctomycetota bacterium]